MAEPRGGVGSSNPRVCRAPVCQAPTDPATVDGPLAPSRIVTHRPGYRMGLPSYDDSVTVNDAVVPTTVYVPVPKP
jgi:hypothetical protein